MGMSEAAQYLLGALWALPAGVCVDCVGQMLDPAPDDMRTAMTELVEIGRATTDDTCCLTCDGIAHVVRLVRRSRFD
jgi:hypothetical protein